MILLQDGMVAQFLISVALFTSASEEKKQQARQEDFRKFNELIY